MAVGGRCFTFTQPLAPFRINTIKLPLPCPYDPLSPLQALRLLRLANELKGKGCSPYKRGPLAYYHCSGGYRHLRPLPTANHVLWDRGG